MANIFVLGAGGFGTSLAISALKSKNNVTLWTKFDTQALELNKTRENKPLLPGIIIPQEIEITTSLTNLKDCHVAIIAVPSQAVREVCTLIKPFLNKDTIVACVAKGFEAVSLKTMSEVMGDELDNKNVVISGPSHAEELAKNIPTAVVAASKNREASEFVQDTLANSVLRIYVNDDVTGVELGGALKNVIALAAGALDGKGLGDNAMAALITRGITEIARLGVACGAKSETFTGLSGIGDLIVTCTSLHSRNRRFGNLIGKGHSCKEALEIIGMTVEGYKNTKSAYELALTHKVEMPITTEVYKILYEDKPMDQAVLDLMGRPNRHECEKTWLASKK